MEELNNKLITTSSADLMKLWGAYIITLDQREQLVKVIDEVVSGLFDNGKKITFDIFPAQFRLGLPVVEFPLKEYEVADLISKYLNEVKMMLLDLPYVELELSFNPSTAFLAIILDQIRLARGDLCLIKYQYDPQVMGGAIIKTDGTIADYSLRKLVDIL